MNFDPCTNFVTTAHALLEPRSSAVATLAELINVAYDRAVVVSDETEITLRQASDLLNEAQSTVTGLVENGVLLLRLVGNRCRLSLGDVLACKARSKSRTLDAIRNVDSNDR